MSKEVGYALLVFIVTILLLLMLRGPLETIIATVSKDEIFNHLLAGCLCRVIIIMALVFLITKNNLLPFLGIRPFQNISSPELLLSPIALLFCLAFVNFEYFIQAEWKNIFMHVLNTLAIGVLEELTMRGILLPLFLIHFRKSVRPFFKAILLSSILFGIAHYGHLVTYPTEALNITTQVIGAVGIGFYFAAIFLRTGNIIIPIIIHALIDLFGGADVLIKAKEEATTTPSLTTWIVLILLTLFLIVVSINMVKKIGNSEWYNKLSYVKLYYF